MITDPVFKKLFFIVNILLYYYIYFHPTKISSYLRVSKKFKMNTLVFATNNEHKLHEVKKMLQGNFSIVSLSDVNIFEDIPEDKPNLEGNAEQKADYIHDKLKINVFADDTGLEIDALNGEPGVYSARYSGKEKDSQANMQKVLNNLTGVKNRKAQFRTVICLILNNEKFFFEGIVRGSILNKPAGKDGFGYDPIFQPNGYDCSFAEMPLEAKNKISHRGIAVEKLINYLNTDKE